jgi:hypothetical protein
MPFFSDLTEEERLHGVFQQGTATAHKAHAVLKQCVMFLVTMQLDIVYTPPPPFP